MKMITKWGYRLAERSFSKGVRVNYRFMKKGSLISVGWIDGQIDKKEKKEKEVLFI